MTDKYRFFIKVQRARRRYINVLRNEMFRRNKDLDGLLTDFLMKLEDLLLCYECKDVIAQASALKYKCASNAKSWGRQGNEEKQAMFSELYDLVDELERLMKE